MTATTAMSAMRRKAGAGRPAPEIDRMTPTRAWKLAVPQAVDDVLGAEAAVLVVDEDRTVRDALADEVVEHALLTLLEGPAGRFGVALIDPSALAAMIEAVTTGRFTSRPVAPRPPTRTDATVAADLLDALLDAFEGHLAEMEDAPNLAGYRYAAHLADARAMTMTLGAGPYSIFRLRLSLGGGVREASVVFAFPVAPRGIATAQDAAVFQERLRATVMSAPTELDAELWRLSLPLSEVTELAAGDLIRMPLSALATVALTARDGRVVARARLGQQSGCRALRIAEVGSGDETEPAGDFEEATPRPAPRALPSAAMSGAPAKGDAPPDLDTAAEGFAPLPDLGDLD